MRNAAAALTSTAVALTAAGCTHRAPAELASGHRIYAQACSSCHSLTGHDTRASGGDLVDPNLTFADLASFARTMPVRPPLSDADVNAVPRYIYATAHPKQH